MRPRLGWSPFLFAAFILCSCAGPLQLAKLSQRQLARGETQQAYETARRAMDKKPENEAARRAMTEAASRIEEDWKLRVMNAARTDTIAAAHAILEQRDFFAELERYHVDLPRDSAFAARAAGIRDAAAGIEYRRGNEAFAAHHPKAAYASFRDAADIVAGYRDVQVRMQQAHDAATSRVAIVPFANDTEVPDLSRGVADAMYGQLAAHIRAPTFEFTKLAERDEVYASMTVKELEALGRDEALRIGRGIDASLVVTGRLHGMRASSAFRSFDRPIFRRVVERDSSGEHTRYVETRFAGVSRERWVTVHCDFDVLDARTGEVVARRQDAFDSDARVVWTDYRAEGDCGTYCLVPPDVKRDDPIHAKEVEDSWHECFGSWRLSDLLERSRRETRRVTYQPGDRGDFRRPSHDHPVLLGELPTEEDLAYVALEDAWQKVLETLRELDEKD
jgi:hypothetical protein